MHGHSAWLPLSLVAHGGWLGRREEVQDTTEACRAVVCDPGGIVRSGIRNIVLKNLGYVDLRVPSCTALMQGLAVRRTELSNQRQRVQDTDA